MPDSVPKPRAQRRRRNRDVSAASLPVAARGGVERPALPMAEPHARTVAWWDAIWASPMASVWLDSDVHELLDLADLKDVQHRGEATAAVLAEIRQIGDRFGLSPLSRRRLQWEVEQAQSAEAPAPVVEDEGRWLRSV